LIPAILSDKFNHFIDCENSYLIPAIYQTKFQPFHWLDEIPHLLMVARIQKSMVVCILK